MMPENKKARIRYANDEIVGKGNVDIVDEVFATDYIAHAGEKNYKGHAFIKRFAGQLRSAIPDVRILEVKFLVQDEDTIAWQRRLGGMHAVDMQGIPASGKKVVWSDMVVTRFNDEKIAEEWVVSELMGALLLNASRA
jgi:predicted ester cyclase